MDDCFGSLGFFAVLRSRKSLVVTRGERWEEDAERASVKVHLWPTGLPDTVRALLRHPNSVFTRTEVGSVRSGTVGSRAISRALWSRPLGVRLGSSADAGTGSVIPGQERVPRPWIAGRGPRRALPDDTQGGVEKVRQE